jgi:hypothetical protein
LLVLFGEEDALRAVSGSLDKVQLLLSGSREIEQLTAKQHVGAESASRGEAGECLAVNKGAASAVYMNGEGERVRLVD